MLLSTKFPNQHDETLKIFFNDDNVNSNSNKDDKICLIISKDIFSIICLRCKTSPNISNPRKIMWAKIERCHYCENEYKYIKKQVKNNIHIYTNDGLTRKLPVMAGSCPDERKKWICKICQHQVYNSKKIQNISCCHGLTKEMVQQNFEPVTRYNGIIFDDTDDVNFMVTTTKKRKYFFYNRKSSRLSLVYDFLMKNKENALLENKIMTKILREDFGNIMMDNFFNSRYPHLDNVEEIFKDAKD